MRGRNDAFEPGEKVMYPQFGLGTITGVIEKEVDDTSQVFYRLEFEVNQIEILVPVARAVENGLRKVMGRKDIDKLISYINSDVPPPKPQQWHRWRKRTLEQLKSGDPLEIATIFRYLACLECQKGLSFTERKILHQVERMLIAEIAVAKSISEAKAETLLTPARNGLANGNGKRAAS